MGEETIRPVSYNGNSFVQQGNLEVVQHGDVSWEVPGKKLAGSLTGINGK